MTPATTAVVMARGLGTRMRRDDAAASLDTAQQAMAATGLKTMIPDQRGRPFLRHLLAALADGGIRDVILVVAPDHSAIRDHFTAHPVTRVTITFAIQPAPTGTADALLAAEPAVAGRPFLVCNADNLYPAAAIAALTGLAQPGVIAFDRDALIRESNIDAARITAFAVLAIGAEGELAAIVEKNDIVDREMGEGRWIGMNLWRFDQEIFTACREVPLSSRGERELPQAVGLALARGMHCRAIPCSAGVLDLSSRGDIAVVADQLGRREVTV